MSTHPLSLREQLLLRFPSLTEVRFVGDSPYIEFFTQVAAADTLPLEEIQRYLAAHSSVSDQVTISASWQAGPSWPAGYDQFTADERKIITGCNGKRESVAAALLHAFPSLSHADTVREKDRTIVVELAFKLSTPDVQAQVDRCVLFAKACYAFAPVTVYAKLINDTEMAGSGRDLDHFYAPRSMRGISEPEIRRLFEFDQDSFRDFQSSGYTSPRKSVQRRLAAPGTLALFWDISSGQAEVDLDLRSVLPLFDHAYVNLQTLLDHQLSKLPLFGIQTHEVDQLLNAGRIIPVASGHLASYDQQSLLRVASEHTIVTPLELAEGIALDMLNRFPLWKLATTDRATALACLRTIDSIVQQSGDSPAHLKPWIEASFAALTDFDPSLRDLGSQIGLRFGMVHILESASAPVFGASLNDPLLLSALDLSISAARGLRASYCPTFRDAAFQECVNFVDGIYENVKISALAEMPMLKNMPRILSSFALDIPPGMNILEWMSTLEQAGLSRIRQVIAEGFAGHNSITDETITADIVRLHAELDRIGHRRKNPMNRVELAGFASAEIAGAMAGSVPLLPTVLALLTKWLSPTLWSKLKDNNTLADAWAILEGGLLDVNVTALRLLHVREQIRR